MAPQAKILENFNVDATRSSRKIWSNTPNGVDNLVYSPPLSGLRFWSTPPPGLENMVYPPYRGWEFCLPLLWGGRIWSTPPPGVENLVYPPLRGREFGYPCWKMYPLHLFTERSLRKHLLVVSGGLGWGLCVFKIFVWFADSESQITENVCFV